MLGPQLPIVTPYDSRYVPRAPGTEADGGPVAPDGSPHYHVVDVDDRSFLYVPDGSRVYEIAPAIAARLSALGLLGLSDPRRMLGALGIPPAATGLDAVPDAPTMRSISLAVAQVCNLACSYCYAQEGGFGGESRVMPLDVARRAVDRLFEEATAGDQVRVAFLGGEPLANRAVLRAATEHAARRGEESGVEVAFSVTTNGTLLDLDDAVFFERHGFAVTISLDGVGADHDRLRPFKGGQGSYDRIVARVAPLLALQERMQVSARVTVTPRNLDLRAALDHFIGLGFHSVGFSPMLSSPTGRDQMDGAGLTTMLAEMIACGREFERQVAAGRRYPFSNMVGILREVHRGTHRPYPCGAGAGYLGVSAEGGLFACHRFVGEDAGAMGDVDSGVDSARQARWLAERHVHRQEPCRSCWARYLCGGGCHHEVLHRGRPACNYIRGWLHYALQAYARLITSCPDYFSEPAPGASRPKSARS